MCLKQLLRSAFTSKVSLPLVHEFCQSRASIWTRNSQQSNTVSLNFNFNFNFVLCLLCMCVCVICMCMCAQVNGNVNIKVNWSSSDFRTFVFHLQLHPASSNNLNLKKVHASGQWKRKKYFFFLSLSSFRPNKWPHELNYWNFLSLSLSLSFSLWIDQSCSHFCDTNTQNTC